MATYEKMVALTMCHLHLIANGVELKWDQRAKYVELPLRKAAATPWL